MPAGLVSGLSDLRFDLQEPLNYPTIHRREDD